MSLFRTVSLLPVLAIFCRALLASGAGAIAEETRVSLDGTWRIQPTDGEEREIAVPSFWERSRGLANVHEATYRLAVNQILICQGSSPLRLRSRLLSKTSSFGSWTIRRFTLFRP